MPGSIGTGGLKFGCLTTDTGGLMGAWSFGAGGLDVDMMARSEWCGYNGAGMARSEWRGYNGADMDNV